MANSNRSTRRSTRKTSRIIVMLNQTQQIRVRRLMKASCIKEDRWEWSIFGPFLVGEPQK